MKRITKDELEVFLRKHKLWLVNDPEGERADLRRADLRRADLRRADLSGAYLSGADLSGADLSGADLRRADLSGADLSGADLSGAYLYGADLRRADLSGADLSGADLRRADLSGANLSCADLRRADLRRADLRRADLSGAKNLTIPIACPEEGSFIGFKKCEEDLIVKLEIPSDALRCSATGRKCRCSKAKVLSITNLDGSPADADSATSKYNPSFTYHIGDTVEEPNFNPNRWDECSAGIHFFITRQEAVDYIH